MAIARFSSVLLCFTLIGLLTGLGRAGAAEGDFFYSRNQHPFVQIFGLPAPESPLVPERAAGRVRLNLSRANSMSSQASDSESLLLDGETTRVEVACRYGLGNRWELGLDLPYVMHEGGFLDDLIEGWHGFFHLPNGSRDGRRQDLLDYSYERDGRLLVQLDSPARGMGDLLFFTGRQLEGAWPLTVRAGLKAPTGDADRLLGSGGWDGFLSLTGGRRDLPFTRWDLFGSAGVLLTGRSEVLNEIRRQMIGFASLGVAWHFCPRLIMKLQIDSHTPFYRSALTGLGTSALQLDIGGSVVLSPDLTVDLAVLEDLAVDTAPDVVFLLGVSRHFK